MQPEPEPLKVYNDAEVRELLGGIGRTTLFEIRRRKRPNGRPLLESSNLYPGGPRRTTARQLQAYIDYLNGVETDAEGPSRPGGESGPAFSARSRRRTHAQADAR